VNYGFEATFLFYIILSITIISCIIFLKSSLKKLKRQDLNIKSYHKKLLSTCCLSIGISFFIVGIFSVYCFNYDANLKVNDLFFSDNLCTINFMDKYNDNYTTILYLPPNSKFCYKTPDMVYYNKNSINKCIKELENKLILAKKEHKIIDFSFSDNKYIIDCENSRTINIDFKTENNKTYFIVSYYK